MVLGMLRSGAAEIERQQISIQSHKLCVGFLDLLKKLFTNTFFSTQESKKDIPQ